MLQFTGEENTMTIGLEYWIGGIVSLALGFYLCYVLIRPERF